MADKKLSRISIDPAKMPKAIREEIDTKLPPALAQAIYAGCHEQDCLLAAELLIELTRCLPGPIAHEENLVACHLRVREARLHMGAFNMHMEDAERMVKAGPAIKVVSESQAKGAGIDLKA